MIEWLFKHIGIVVFLVIFITQVLRAFSRSRQARSEHEAQRDAAAEDRRVREIQERIRRQIADRRGGMPAAPPPLASRPEPRPLPRPQTTQLPELVGGPLGRMLEELQKRVQPPPAPPPVVTPRPAHAEPHHVTELERQQKLADEMKALAEARALAQRRAAHLAADRQAEAESEPALRSAAREHVLADLADPQALRRAFVLREVLGPPLALR